MARSKKTSESEESNSQTTETRTRRRKTVTLKDLAKHLNLSTATVSLVLNRSPVASSIPEETQQRVFKAAEELRYQPNYMARSLRSRRSYSVGVLVPNIGEDYAAGVMSGVEAHLVDNGYFYLAASHHWQQGLMEKSLDLLQDRSVEAYILVATPISRPPSLPTVAVAGHHQLPGVTNVVIDHDAAAAMALKHLTDLGHREIAFFKGHPGNVDTEDRWRAILQQADELGLEIPDNRKLQLADAGSGQGFTTEERYRESYALGQKLIEDGIAFTALFAFNDVTAIGAMRAFIDAGRRVPDDISVIGFDDIQSAAFHNPSLTTIRQPLVEMGRLAAEIVLEKLQKNDEEPRVVTVEPELVVRESTGPPSRG